MNRQELERLIAAVERESSNQESKYHGPQHWRCVALVGIRLARMTDNADPLVAFLFGLFHDSMRENEDYDCGHGTRGAKLADAMAKRGLLTIEPSQLAHLIFACTEHTEAEPTNDPINGVCFDADRLNLWRVGVEPNARYLSTWEGCTQAYLRSTRGLHEQRISWSDVLEELFATSL